ncbi:MAG: ATP-binding cassette domain-containing protein [Lachnospiraceae bacterium]|nr:ATP-binding cassette domain-containing protein [Lachnospiraceae bacterium]MBR4145761.1 ATP-binding cassette domain-containing protein [Lachnospiraceae bacterium]
MSYIEVNNLRKTFTVRKKREKGKLFREKEIVSALAGISFVVEKGELVGYIGPNGAGKSTTVKILSGILTPESGEAKVGGMIPWKDRKDYVKHIGVVFGQRSQLWWDVPIVDSYSLLKDIYRIPEKDYKSRMDELVEALQLEKLLRTPLRLLSLGQKMRAELCGSLLHRPDILFLDEPTIGLDAVSKLALRDFLKWENKEHGTTIMLTTHDMEDIAALCSRVMVLGHGQKLFDGHLKDLLERFDTVRTVTVKYNTDEPKLNLPEKVQVERSDGEIKITYSPSEIPTANMLALLQDAGTISEMTLESENIDHLIAAMYKEMDL